MNSSRVIGVGAEPPPLKSAEKSCRPSTRANPKGKKNERFGVVNSFVDFTLAELSRAEIAIWLILWRDTRDGSARTGYDDLARRAGVNRRNVGRALRRLECLGLVIIVHRGGFRQGLSRYRVCPLVSRLPPPRVSREGGYPSTHEKERTAASSRAGP